MTVLSTRPVSPGLKLRYEDGTVVLADPPTGLDPADLPGVEADPRTGDHRAPAHRYAALRAALDERAVAVDDGVLDAPALDVESAYELRPYQRDALAAWTDVDRRGVVEMPTGSGKTVVGVAAVAAVGRAALVVVPTVDLLGQWRRELSTALGLPDDEVGRLGGGEQRLAPLTVATYDSAYLRAAGIGDRFGLVVFDEVHHLGGESYRDVARLSAAPARLGLTATFERPDGAHEAVADLVGERVVSLDADDLAGEYLAEHDVRRLEVELTDAERERYEAAQDTFVDYLRHSDLDLSSGADWQKLVLRSGSDPRAREALLAKQEAREVMMNADRKVALLGELLDRHRDDRVIVFTAHTDLVYRLSERFLLPAITGETGAGERERILDAFRSGTYSRVVTANVLDEGIDVPDANVAVVLSGSGSERQFTQRLGRILRPAGGDAGRAERATLYEVVTADTAEERVAGRRR